MQRSVAAIVAALGMTLAVSACTDPYDPGQRAVGGGLLGAGAGAAIGGLAGGGRGAAAGALIGGAAGAAVGAATAPRQHQPSINRRQYYDERAGRYYYFDPSTGRYYWENGQPR